MKKFKLIPIAIITLLIGNSMHVQAQSLIEEEVIWVQDFDFRLNSKDSLKVNNTTFDTSYGGNKWTINNVYAASNPGDPNTTSQYLKVGNIGQISYPNQNYLHISSDTMENAHFDPTDASKWSTTMATGICTHGYNKIKLAFWWLAGNSGGYGKVKYTLDFGATWTTCINTDGDSIYENQSIWKFSKIEDTALLNRADIRFGFFWENGSGSGSKDLSFAIDDIIILGEWDASNPTVQLDAGASIGMNHPQYCHEWYGYTSYSFVATDDLCPGGYTIQISDSSGSFASPTNLWTFSLGNAIGGQVITVGGNAPFQTNFPAGKHYRYRIMRTTPPYITGLPSPYFEIFDTCRDIVEVNMTPAIINDPYYSPGNPANPPGMPADQQPACNCSAIDVKFFSYGAFNPGNTYSLELSDTAGNFDNPVVFGGPQASTRTWDPAAPWMPPPPGSISGQIPCDTTQAPPSCNYYLRVVSSDTTDIFIPWGPFCIKKCDVITNKTIDISCCITPDHGWDTLIPIDINKWDPSIFYNLGNEFKVQLCHPGSPFIPPMTIMSEGDIGILVDTTSGLLFLSIPDLAGWTALGLDLQMYYMRIISTDGSDVTDILGAIIRLTVDGMGLKPLTISINPDSVGCNMPQNVTFTALPGPFPPTSKFIWTLDGYANDPLPSSVYTYSGGWSNGPHTVSVREIGPMGICIGPTSDEYTWVIEGPQVEIIGVTDICMGDTVTYSTEFFEGTWYEWSFAGPGIMIDSANNQITIYWPTSPFPYTGSVNLKALMENGCYAENSMPVNVSADFDAVISVPADTTVCAGACLDLVASNSKTSFLNEFTWTSVGSGEEIGDSSLLSICPDTTGTYKIEIDHEGCKRSNQITVEVIGTHMEQIDTGICDNSTEGVELSVWFNVDHATNFYWSPAKGLTNPNIVNPIAKPTETTTYSFNVEFDVCDPDTALTTVTVYATDFVVGPPVDITLVKGQSTTLKATGGIFYTWTPATGLTDTTIANPIATPEESTTYTVTMIDRNGCVKKGTVVIKVIERPEVLIPNAFSPNGDGENDKFYAIDLGIEDLIEFRIFNRWGEVVFETSDINEGWDGTYKGKQQEMGTYIYYVKALTMQYNDQKEIVEMQGDVTLVR